MDSPVTPAAHSAAPFQLGDWRVEPAQLLLQRGGGEPQRLEARTMRLLVYLAGRAGDVVSADELLERVWAGVVVSQDSVYQAVATLRRALGDDPRQPVYLATVPRQGYRLLQRPSAVPDETTPPVTAAATLPGAPRRRLLLAGLLLAVPVAGWLAWRERPAGPPRQPSGIAPPRQGVAVLPFLDLTEAMDQEYFADGMTVQLIELLGRDPELRVPARSLVFAYKGKGTPVAAIAQALHVGYVVEGSVRSSEGTVRVSAQLVRADTGFVVWSESYDRAVKGQLRLQDDIAAEMIRSLKAALAAATPPR